MTSTPTVSAPATLMSVDQVAQILSLHVRTIRAYVRSGALKATRIGKQYRIAPIDLEAFTGRPVEQHDERVIAAHGRVEIASVFTVESVTPALASRVTNTVMASAAGPRGTGESLAVTTAYDVEQDRLRILVSADLATMHSFMALIVALLERPAAAPQLSDSQISLSNSVDVT
jgi:excisionase family DNA binding protein